MLLFINNQSYFITSYQLLNDYTTQESKLKNFTKISTHYKIRISLKNFILTFPSPFFFSLLSLSPSPSQPSSFLRLPRRLPFPPVTPLLRPAPTLAQSTTKSSNREPNHPLVHKPLGLLQKPRNIIYCHSLSHARPSLSLWTSSVSSYHPSLDQPSNSHSLAVKSLSRQAWPWTYVG